jgi:hypothetical protein
MKKLYLKIMELFIAFQDSSPSFTLGFEAGEIFTLCANGLNIKRNVHRANKEQLEEILKAFKYSFSFLFVSDEWLELEAMPIKLVPQQRGE